MSTYILNGDLRFAIAIAMLINFTPTIMRYMDNISTRHQKFFGNISIK